MRVSRGREDGGEGRVETRGIYNTINNKNRHKQTKKGIRVKMSVLFPETAEKKKKRLKVGEKLFTKSRKG